MTRLPLPTWLLVAVGVMALVVIGVIATVVYVNVSVMPLHTVAADVPSRSVGRPSARWADAVKDGQQIARTAVVEQNLPALSVAIGVRNESVWAESFGWANLETRQPVEPEMAFRIGHVSKALTSAAVGLLREQGRLLLDAEIQEYVPSYPKKAWPVTVRQLMAHMAGVRHYRDTEWGDKPTTRCVRAIDGVASFAIDPLLFAPESEARYSTYGWVLVSAAVERVAGEAFADVMRAKVFAPLGMTQTLSESDTAAGVPRVTSYFRNNFNRETTTSVDYSCFAGGGAFWSTPSDLVRFGLGMLGGRLLQPDTVRLLHTRQALQSGSETTYGLGWSVETAELAGERTLLVSQASRTIEGASTSFLLFPEHAIVVAVSANMSFADTRSVARALADRFAKAALPSR